MDRWVRTVTGALAVMTLLAAGDWAAHRALDDWRCRSAATGHPAFYDGRPPPLAAYVPPIGKEGTYITDDVLAAAKRFRGDAALGPLRWAAAHHVLAPYVDPDLYNEASPDVQPVRLTRVADGTVVITAPLRESGEAYDGWETSGAFTGVLRLSDGRVLWTGADPGHGTCPVPPIPAVATRTPSATRRYTYRVAGSADQAPDGRRDGLEVTDRATGRVTRTARFLPGEDVDTVGDTAEIAVADGTLIAEVGNLTLAFDLPPAS